MADAILVLNAGSSSLKASVFTDEEAPRAIVRAQLEGLKHRPRFVARSDGTILADDAWRDGTALEHGAAVDYVLGWLRDALPEHRVVAVGHRVVHGGTRFERPTIIDDDTIEELEALVPLAPLHQPHNVAAIRAVATRAPALPQVACFDTAFHATQPWVARAFGLPRHFEDEGLRRYGFHGLSYEYIASALATVAPEVANDRVVVLHLGNGASMCAMREGKSVATTMSFTALDGLVMGTRCGALDPGVLLYLMNQGMGPIALQRLLYEESGLLGISGISGDMRELLARADGDRNAADAVDLFVHRILRELGSLAAALGGVEALVFTGGIGENAAVIRERVCRGASWLGLVLDSEANRRENRQASRISRRDSLVSVWVIPTNEELTIARHTRDLTRTARMPVRSANVSSTGWRETRRP